jgi:hypothetical protein
VKCQMGVTHLQGIRPMLGEYGISWGALRSSDLEGTLDRLYPDFVDSNALRPLIGRDE